MRSARSRRKTVFPSVLDSTPHKHQQLFLTNTDRRTPFTDDNNNDDDDMLQQQTFADDHKIVFNKILL